MKPVMRPRSHSLSGTNPYQEIEEWTPHREPTQQQGPTTERGGPSLRSLNLQEPQVSSHSMTTVAVAPQIGSSATNRRRKRDGNPKEGPEGHRKTVSLYESKNGPHVHSGLLPYRPRFRTRSHIGQHRSLLRANMKPVAPKAMAKSPR